MTAPEDERVMEPDLRDRLLDSGEIELYIDEDKLENMVSFKVWNLLILKLTISQLVFIRTKYR